jgi:DNA-binding protein H-NS
MSDDLQSMLAQQAELQRKIAAAQANARAEAIAKVRSMMAEYGLTPADLGSRTGSILRHATTGRKVDPKYRNPATGETWTGRGLQPRWVRSELATGRSLTDFAITQQ